MDLYLSVHNIVDFVLRSGSVVSASTLSKRALSGTKVHKKIQSRHGKKASKKGFFFDSEFVLKNSCRIRNYQIYAEGRADGLIEGKDKVYIEEIKSTGKALDTINKENAVPAHLAQLKCYGYMYSAEYGAENVNLYLTYCDVSGKNEITFEYNETAEDLKGFYFELLEEYCGWVDFYMSFLNDFKNSGAELKFPYGSFRTGQRELSAAVYNTMVSNKQFFVQAPTGTGKTISTLFPTVKYMAEYGKISSKIFYATAKNQTRAAAEEAVFIMKSKGLKAKSITLSAKAKICTNRECICSPEKCIYANGHFDRVNGCIKDILENVDIIKKDDIVFYAEKHIVCPFELSLDLTLFSHIIICDYNYIYDTKAQLDRFFGEDKKTDKPVVLIDEAHNFPDRAREMYTAEINTQEIREALKLFGRSKIYNILIKIYSLVCRTFENRDEKSDVFVSGSFPKELIEEMQGFIYAVDSYIEKRPDIINKEKIMDFYFKVNDFVKISEYFDKNYSVTAERTSEKNIRLKLFCADASGIAAEINKKILSLVCFSATFEPLDYFISVCGGMRDANKGLTASPFPRGNLLVICDVGISTRYKEREKSYEGIAKRIYYLAESKKGNYFAFFPSYSYMNAVYEIFTDLYPNISVLCQKISMTEAEGNEFLKEFEKERENSFVAFAVLGGIFSEGIDLKYERLIGAVVVGTGLPQVCLERNIMSEYYGKCFGNGFNYAYKYPGINKVLQAAGRVIRTEKDKGVVLLIDDRYSKYEYTSLFPGFWTNKKTVSSLYEIKNELVKFWKP